MRSSIIPLAMSCVQSDDHGIPASSLVLPCLALPHQSTPIDGWTPAPQRPHLTEGIYLLAWHNIGTRYPTDLVPHTFVSYIAYCHDRRVRVRNRKKKPKIKNHFKREGVVVVKNKNKNPLPPKKKYLKSLIKVPTRRLRYLR